MDKTGKRYGKQSVTWDGSTAVMKGLMEFHLVILMDLLHVTLTDFHYIKVPKFFIVALMELNYIHGICYINTITLNHLNYITLC